MCADNFLYASAASGAKTTSYRILATLWPDLTPQAMLPPVGGPPPKKRGRPGPLARQVNVKCVYTTRHSREIAPHSVSVTGTMPFFHLSFPGGTVWPGHRDRHRRYS